MQSTVEEVVNVADGVKKMFSKKIDNAQNVFKKLTEPKTPILPTYMPTGNIGRNSPRLTRKFQGKKWSNISRVIIAIVFVVTGVAAVVHAASSFYSESNLENSRNLFTKTEFTDGEKTFEKITPWQQGGYFLGKPKMKITVYPRSLASKDKDDLNTHALTTNGVTYYFDPESIDVQEPNYAYSKKGVFEITPLSLLTVQGSYDHEKSLFMEQNNKSEKLVEYLKQLKEYTRQEKCRKSVFHTKGKKDLAVCMNKLRTLAEQRKEGTWPKVGEPKAEAEQEAEEGAEEGAEAKAKADAKESEEDDEQAEAAQIGASPQDGG